MNEGTFIEAALKAMKKQPDPRLPEINAKMPDLFRKNGLTEGRKWAWRELLTQVMV